MSVSATSDIIQSGDTSTLTATYVGANVSGKTVVFKKGSTTLDTQTTDSSGQASYTYTGSAAGVVTITVECMSLQETYELIDAQFLDMINGIDNANAIYYNNCTKSIANGVKTVTGTSSSNWGDIIISSTHFSTDAIYFNLPFKVKIEITDILSDFIFSVKTDGQSRVYSDWTTATGVYELQVSANSLIIKKDGSVIASKTGNINSSAMVGIHLKPLQSVTYKDLMIYPI